MIAKIISMHVAVPSLGILFSSDDDDENETSVCVFVTSFCFDSYGLCESVKLQRGVQVLYREIEEESRTRRRIKLHVSVSFFLSSFFISMHM